MGNNKSLGKAKDAKNDEFYTQISDIERELKHYREHFKGATVLCNCDDPEYSNFWKYFHLNFEFFGLKKLITTHYHETEPTYKMEYEGGNDNDITVGVITPLKTNGDFRSPECIELLKEATIVVTNPPFSLFRDYLAQLIEYGKSFVVLSNPNALHYKEIFPLVQDNKLWLGYKSMSSDMLFDVKPEFAEELVKTKKQGSGYKIIDGVVKGRAQAIWVTNLDISKRHDLMDLVSKYSPEKYPKYENFDAIEINKVADIPVDYFGMMGVPDSFLDSYNPDQFEIIGYGRGDFLPEIDTIPVSFLEDYRNAGGKGHVTAGMKSLCFYDADHNAKFPYSRIIVRRKEVKSDEN